MNIMQHLFIIVGSPGSGKDLLIRAVNDLGAQHAEIVPKHTSRQRWDDDGNEMICVWDPEHDLANCDIIYENYGDKYGIKGGEIWEGLSKGVFQVIVVSDVDAINKLRRVFGELVVLVYVHSEVDADEYQCIEAHGKDSEYVQCRVAEYELAFNVYLENFLAFDHVLIYSGLKEDLFDQIFRLFRAYEIDLGHAATKTPVSRRVWKEIESYGEPVIIGGKRHLPPRV